ncbi:MAG: amidohydrolase family protein [bacterium]|nr:amidohydrolase family protein [bacterium]
MVRISALVPALLAVLPCAAVHADGLAIRARKVLLAELDGRQFLDNAVVLVEDGRIVAVGAADEVVVPDGYELIDAGDQWISPGMIDLHSHVGGPSGDLNGTVYQINPGLRISSAVVPNNMILKRAVAGGVTTVLFIPGSGSNMGGQGILMKTDAESYEAGRVRDPGSLKVAQGDNPTRWGYGMGRQMMNFHLRTTLRKGRAYAQRWKAYEEGRGPKPEREIQRDLFRSLFARETQVSTHTQYYQLVMMSIAMLAGEFGLDTYIDHGSFDSYLTTDQAKPLGVAAILGPREVMWPRPPRYRTDGQAHGTAWGFQKEGHDRIGFNTDAVGLGSFTVAQEELSTQAAMSVRYGLDDSSMEGVRGLTIIPATAAGIADRVGSIEVGKDADLLITTGDPADPRSAVTRVLIGGVIVYDTEHDRRRW